MLPFVKEINYIEPGEALLRLAQETNLCFLDSAKQQDTVGRYSYIGIDPFLTVQSKENRIFVNGKKFSGNPFDLLQAYLSLYKSNIIKNLPPLQGGAMGYFSYDLLHHLEKIPQAQTDEIAIPDMYISFYDCIIAFDCLQHKAWIISQGFPETNIALRQSRARERASWLFKKISCTSELKIKTAWNTATQVNISSTFNQTNYCTAVKKIIDYIYAGDIFQANIAQCFSCDLPANIKPIELYMALRVKNSAPFAALLIFDGVCIASASPERFIRLQDGVVETRPIKGTRPRGKTIAEDKQLANELINSEKDRAENIMIVDLMRNDLARVCSVNSIQVTQLCQLESYETVHHLVSAIEAKLSAGKDAIDLLKATFPGGSVTGAPKIRAMEIIYEIEPHARAAYCGSIGYIGFDGSMDTSIVIRTYIIKANRVYFQAGSGIVADSNPLAEYEETLIKAYALKGTLQGKQNL
jgi:para-aminobenzoate synthetase component 1